MATETVNGTQDAEPNSLTDLATTADRYLDSAGIDATANAPETNNLGDVSGADEMGLSPPTSPGKTNRSQSREWDASKVPPSQFQRRKGSIYSTPQSRDGHVAGKDRDKAYHDKIKEKTTGTGGIFGWFKNKS
ncbi:hypothetical protein NA57DRAFT_52426 [Rhizodiscina lignyota]|uniref:Uncharacterized protein n=1 Tax=Rhizodiscina lignyota TaxID=1504668 RepID=A0A9P4M9N2_9PEZI|nr:hypothetical protein NA57DRAFT_52426 [Rhizodiscina lignyota]